MKIWGPGPLQNEHARAYAREVLEDGPVALQEALDVILDEPGYVEAPEAARAVAAAAMIAHATGAPAPEGLEPDEHDALRGWADDLRAMRAQALGALEVSVSPDSELTDYYEDRPDRQAWLDGTTELRERLAPGD